MRILCPRCRRPLKADELRMSTLEAACLGCGATFSFAASVPEPPAPQVVVEGPPPRDVTRSHRVAVSVDAGGMTLRRRWFRFSSILELIIAVVIGVVVVRIFVPGVRSAPTPPPAWVWGIVGFFALGVGSGVYHALAGLLNVTTIRVTPEGVRLRHAPLPWWRNRFIATTDLAQLSVVEQVASRGGASGGQRIYYDLVARTHSGRRRRLLSVEEYDEARAIEDNVEEALGIVDDGE